MRPLRCIAAVCFLMLGSPATRASASLTLTGSGPDVEGFLAMLETCTCKDLGLAADGRTVQQVGEQDPQNCPKSGSSMRQLLEKILGGSEAVAVTLVRNAPGVLVDAFGGDGAGRADMDDLETIGSNSPPEDPHLSDRCENIAHFLAEYWCAATNGIPAGAAGNADYNNCHPVPSDARTKTGIGAENVWRVERGMSGGPIVGIGGGGGVLRQTYSDGSVEIWDFDAGCRITRRRGPQ